MDKQTICVYGMGVMGQNIARNLARNGADVVAYNRTKSKITDLLEGPGKDLPIRGAYSLEELRDALPKPRKVLIMVEAGPATDKVIDGLTEVLEPGDIIVDGGNSYFRDTERRAGQLQAKGLKFFGMGISGGEEGALKGPSMMPGGDRESFEYLRPMLEAAAAKTDDGPCVAYLGPGGAGHLVKMVHNGIEYGDMQLIAEAYDILRSLGQIGPERMREVFEQWNQSELGSYLIEITTRIVDFPDDQGADGLLLDHILDAAGQKGTGRWTVMLAAEMASPLPTISAAVDARVLSSFKDQRLAAAKVFPGPEPLAPGDVDLLIDDVRDALLASKICSYAQGMALLDAASREFDYHLDLSEIARIWQAGCIIRAGFLKDISAAFTRNADLPNLMVDPQFAETLTRCEPAWRRVVSLAAETGIPTAAFNGSLAYFDSYRRERLPAYLIQAQRDFFGAHTYKRTDREGTFHTTWPEMID